MHPIEMNKMRRYLDRGARPIFEDFMRRHGLSSSPDVGHSPRLRGEIVRSDGALQFVDFWMALNDHGKYYEAPDDETPHELGGGIGIDRDEADGCARYIKVETKYLRRPYAKALVTLAADLEDLWNTISGWSLQDLYASRRVLIRPRDG